MELTGLYIVIVTAAVFSLLGMLYVRGKKSTPEQFISARNSVALWGTIATIVASGMGAWILFSPAETGATTGVAGIIGYALGSGGAVLLLAWLGRVLRDRMPKGHTLTEFVHLRYGRAMYILILIIMTFYMGVYLSAELTGMAQAAQIMYDIPLWVTALIIGSATLAYTVFGGIRATVFTDKVQTLIILPLLAVLFIAALAAMSGSDPVQRIQEAQPGFLDPLWGEGVTFGLTLLIAIIAAELFNQGNWQRVYIARDTRTMRRAFILSGLMILPIIAIAGSFGLMAVAREAAAHPSVSLFTLVMTTLPSWLGMVLIVLAVALIMSSMDTLLNGLVSLYTVNFAKFRPQASSQKVLSFSKIITVLIAGVAIFISTQGWSVLYLFLVADLVCVGAVFPVFYGLFVKKHSPWAALSASIAGIGAGAFLFPDPAFSRGNLFLAFVVALGVSVVLSVILTPFGKSYDLEQLKEGETVLGRE